MTNRGEQRRSSPAYYHRWRPSPSFSCHWVFFGRRGEVVGGTSFFFPPSFPENKCYVSNTQRPNLRVMLPPLRRRRFIHRDISLNQAEWEELKGGLDSEEEPGGGCNVNATSAAFFYYNNRSFSLIFIHSISSVCLKCCLRRFLDVFPLQFLHLFDVFSPRKEKKKSY